MSRRILVTGATGLLGGELLLRLRGGLDQVIPCGRRASDLPNYERVDLADPAAALRLIRSTAPHAIVHLAGGTARDRHELFRNNVLSTVHLLEAAAGLPVAPYCIVLGSAAEYGDGSGTPLSETAPLRPVSEYGYAKVAQTTLAQAIANRRGIPLTLLRPFNVVSPRLPETTALGNLRRQLTQGTSSLRTLRCGRLDIVRDYVPAASVAEAMARLLENPAPGEVLNVCSGIGVELASVVEAMAAFLGVECRIEPDPKLLAIPAARCVVGDASALHRTLALRIHSQPESLAALLLQGRQSTPAHPRGAS